MEKFIQKANVLVEAIPYIHEFRKKVFVIKYGGSILEDERIRKNDLEDIVFLSFVGIRTILVHGGGPHISSRLKEKGIAAKFHNGIRVTDQETLTIVEEELDKLNRQIVAELNTYKGDAIGIKGNANIIHVEKKTADEDLGFVGTITRINKDEITRHLQHGLITVITPMGIGEKNQPYNINADEAASALAISFQAEKLVLLTNVPGVLLGENDPSTLISTLKIHEAVQLIEKGIIRGGMIPKVNSCLETVQGGVRKAHIVDARLKHALLLEIFTDQGIGTQIITAD